MSDHGGVDVSSSYISLSLSDSVSSSPLRGRRVESILFLLTRVQILKDPLPVLRVLLNNLERLLQYRRIL